MSEGAKRPSASEASQAEGRRSGAAAKRLSASGASQAEGGRSGAAFFDLDRTLIEGSSAFHFGRAAYKAGLRSRRRLAQDVWANLRFRLRGSTDAATDELSRRILDSLSGLRRRDLARLAPEVLTGVLPRVYPQMLRLAYEHQDAGRQAFIVTAASHDIAELLAHVLVLDGGIGTRYELEDGVYTGRLAAPMTYREGKADAVRRVASERGIDLSASYAYSDSESDVPMLRAVGHPVAVNPDAELARIAREEGWLVMRFDKLGRRLRVASALAAVALVGGGGGYVAAQLGRRRRLRLAAAVGLA